jgi:hypothetical protein
MIIGVLLCFFSGKRWKMLFDMPSMFLDDGVKIESLCESSSMCRSMAVTDKIHVSNIHKLHYIQYLCFPCR